MRVLPITAMLIVGLAAAGSGFARTPVYGPRGGGIRFSHLHHEHVACEACHPVAGSQERPVALSLGAHRACQGCHPAADEGKPASPACQVCHGSAGPKRPERAAAALKFSHRVHAQTSESCRTCHVPERESSSAGLLPAAARCERCHAALVESGRCDACHPADASGRLILSAASGRLIPRGVHGGDDHGAGWEKEHGRVARARERRCRVCHDERGCDTCHRGVTKPYRIHPDDWALSHPGPARSGLMSCEGCHRSQSSCLACHRATRVAETAEPRPRNLRLHPAGYRDQHAQDARRNLRACTSCHTEGDCIRCHGSAGLGAGVSPHPLGFRGRCGLLRSRNERPCLKCHPPQDLEARCP